MKNTVQNLRVLNTDVLKIFACITMAIDHFAYIYFYKLSEATYYICRGIGRMAFPIFCFMIVQGIIHTRSLSKYFIRLGIFAVLSEIPFDLLVNGKMFSAKMQNVIFTLLIGACCAVLLKMADERAGDRAELIIYGTIITVSGCILAELLCTDYGYIGVIYIVVFYIFRRHPVASPAAFALSAFVIYSVRIVLGDNSVFGLVNFSSIFAAIPLLLYSGKKGMNLPGTKYLFYIFYPLHMLVLFILEKYFILF